MSKTNKHEKAISPVLSVLLMVIIVFALGIVLFNFITGLIENFTETDSPQPFSLYVGNVNINETCMTIHIGNRLNHEVCVEKAYINDELRQILNPNGIAQIPCNSTGIIYIKGPYTAAGLYNIKLIFNSGQSLIYVARY
jgi:flagellin-like protein